MLFGIASMSSPTTTNTVTYRCAYVREFHLLQKQVSAIYSLSQLLALGPEDMDGGALQSTAKA